MTTAFINGCFDLIHSGHLELLEFAASLADRLVVSIASDATLRSLKREPIICEHDRWRMVSALRCVDHAFIARGAGWRDFEPYLRNLRPEVWVVDANDPHRAEKEALAVELGVRIVWNHRPEAGCTTSGLIERICATITRPPVT